MLRRGLAAHPSAARGGAPQLQLKSVSSASASSNSACTSMRTSSTPRASASARACGAKSGAATIARTVAAERVAQRLLAIAHDLLDRGCDGLDALDLDEHEAAAAYRGTRGRPGPTSVRRSRSTTTRPDLDHVRLAHEALVQLQLASLALEPRLILQLHAAVVVDRLDDDRQRLAARRARCTRMTPSSSRTTVGPGM